MVLLAAPGHAGIAPVEEALREKACGRDDAPVTIIEYASLGCPHCAHFHADTFPKIKEAYIDTGKVRMVYRDFPLGTPAFAASMIARCAGHQRFFGMIEILFRSQSQWSRANNPLNELKRVARFGGMAPTDVDACIQNRDVAEGIRKVALHAQNEVGIEATPSFLVDGKVYSGALSFEKFKEIIDGALARAKSQ